MGFGLGFDDLVRFFFGVMPVRIPGTPGTPERQKGENEEKKAAEIQGKNSRTIQTISFGLSWGCVLCVCLGGFEVVGGCFGGVWGVVF